QIREREEEVYRRLVAEFGEGNLKVENRKQKAEIDQSLLTSAATQSREGRQSGVAPANPVRANGEGYALGGLAGLPPQSISPGRFFLIRRQDRKNFKAGNIANFLEDHGAQYDFMLVLDADSIMLGETIKRLILQMQVRPDLGLLQTIIIPIRA